MIRRRSKKPLENTAGVQHFPALQQLCIKGIAGKDIPGLENISLQTWVELMGIYRMLTYDQPMPPMTKDAGIVISKVGLN